MMHYDSNMKYSDTNAKVDRNLISPFSDISLVVCCSLEKAMATQSRTLAWKITWTEEPGGLQSMGSPLSDFTFTFHFHALEKEMAAHSSVLA